MAECINFESYFQRREDIDEFKPRNCKEWTVRNTWSINPSPIQKIILAKDDYFESYYYADLEITPVFQKCNAKIVKSERMASNNIQFVINGEEYSCFEGYPNIDNRFQEQMYRYKITLIPILQFTKEIFKKPGKRTKIDLLEGLKTFSDDISLLKDADYYDIIVCCGIREVKAHRNILAARSTLFHKFLHGAEEDEEIKKCLKIERKVISSSDGDGTTVLAEINNDIKNGPGIKKYFSATAMFTEESKDDRNGFEKEMEFNNKGAVSAMSPRKERESEDSLEKEKLSDDSSAMFIENAEEAQNSSKSNQENVDDDYNDNSRTVVKSEKLKEVQDDSETKNNDNVTIMSASEGEKVQTFLRAETPNNNNNNNKACKLTTLTYEKGKDHNISEREERAIDKNKNNDSVSATYKEDYEVKMDSESESEICEEFDDDYDTSGDYDRPALFAENDNAQNGSKIKFENKAEDIHTEEDKKEQNSLETEAVLNRNAYNVAKCTWKEKKVESGLEIKQEVFNDNEYNNNDDILATWTENGLNQNDSETDSKNNFTADNMKEDLNIIKVQLENICPSIFDEFIDFIYSGRYETFENQKAKDLLKAARAYGINDLENKCVLYLKTQISMETCKDIYNFAGEIKCEKLQNYVLDYIKNKVIGREQKNVPLIPIAEEEKVRWMRIMRTHTAYLSNILKVKKNKEIRNYLWGDATADCAQCLEDILDVCVVSAVILNNFEG